MMHVLRRASISLATSNDLVGIILLISLALDLSAYAAFSENRLGGSQVSKYAADFLP
jgi:hypothetical protein